MQKKLHPQNTNILSSPIINADEIQTPSTVMTNPVEAALRHTKSTNSPTPIKLQAQTALKKGLSTIKNMKAII